MFIESEVRENVLTLILNDPRRRNAMGEEMRSELYAALLQAADHPDIRALVLRGAGGNFCSGGDLDAMPPADEETGRDRLEKVGALVRLLAGFPKPTLALVEGAAAGLGAGLACACDYVALTANARVLFPFTKLGLLPDAGTLHTLGARVGTSRARLLLLEAATLDAAACLDLGLADAVIPEAVSPEGQAQGHLPDEVFAKARELASRGPAPVAAIKDLFSSGLPSLDAVLAAEAKLQPLFFLTEDFAEGKAAFRQKRLPRFTGR